MILLNVTGSMVAPQKVASMTGDTLLAIEPLRFEPGRSNNLVPTQRTLVAHYVEIGSRGRAVHERI